MKNFNEKLWIWQINVWKLLNTDAKSKSTIDLKNQDKKKLWEIKPSALRPHKIYLLAEALTKTAVENIEAVDVLLKILGGML